MRVYYKLKCVGKIHRRSCLGIDLIERDSRLEIMLHLEGKLGAEGIKKERERERSTMTKRSRIQIFSSPYLSSQLHIPVLYV